MCGSRPWSPGFVMGPSLTPDQGTSVSIVRRLLTREMPMCPNVPFCCVDVRDVADAHVAVLLAPRDKVEGRRFITATQSLTFTDMGVLLHEEFGKMGYHPPTMAMPKFVGVIASVFVPELRQLLPQWNRRGATYDSKPAEEVLGIKFRDVRESIKLTGHSLVLHGIVNKTSGYVARWEPPRA